MKGSKSPLDRLPRLLLRRGLRFCAAESCTGGWIGKVCTDQPGSSDWFEGTLVTYSNEAKQSVLGVDAEVLNQHGAVSERTVCAMTEGALARLPGADVAVAVSGIVGPDGGTERNPVGTVWFAWQFRGQPPYARRFQFAGERDAVRDASVRTALDGAADLIEDS